jgi:YggT family protein
VPDSEEAKIREKALQSLNLLGLFSSFRFIRTYWLKAMTGVNLTSWILSPILGLMIFLFIFRIILTWYPQVNLNRLPFNLIAWPTEPFLVPLRKLIQPIGGVDITPILWVGIFSLVREILLGQQGLLTMMSRIN